MRGLDDQNHDLKMTAKKVDAIFEGSDGSLSPLEKAAISAVAQEAIDGIERGAYADALKIIVNRLQVMAGRLDDLHDKELAEQVRFGLLSLMEVRDSLMERADV